MKRVLITGADSFVGKKFAQYSSHGHTEEICLIKNKAGDIDFTGFDTVLHVAAIVHQSARIAEKEYFRINRDLCLSVARKAKESGIRQFVFMSTVKVYGDYDLETGPWTETTECRPTDPYGRSKYEAEIELKKLEDSNFSVSIIRTPLIYGKDTRANMLRIMKLVDRWSVLPFGNINNKRSFTFAKNLIGFIDRVIDQRASGVFIAMDSESLSTTQLVELIAKYLGKKIRLIHLPGFIVAAGKRLVPRLFERLFDSFEMENSHTLHQLDYYPSYTAEEGISEMVQAYVEDKR
jgi:UDP-glucose 4-epimerase